MATENILINIVANAQGLSSTIDNLVKMGKVTQEDAETFKRLASETAKYSQEAQKAGTQTSGLTQNLQTELGLVQGVADAYIEAGANFKKGSAEKQAAVKKETEELKKLVIESEKATGPDAQKASVKAISDQIQKVKELTGEFGGLTGAASSLRAELFQAREQLAQMKLNGEDNTEAFAELAKRAAQIKTELDNTNKTLKALNPAEKLNAFVRLGSGIAGAFTAAQGAAALLGDESEDVAQAILKIQAALAVTQGFNSLLQLKDVFKDIQVVLGLTSAAQTTFNTAQEAGVVSTNIFAAAQQRLSATLLASPMAPLIITLGAVAAALLVLKKATDDQAESQERLNKITEEYERTLKNLEEDILFVQNRVSDELKRQIDILQAQGGKEIEIFELRKASIESELRSLAQLNGTRGKLTEDELKRQKDLRNELEVIEIQKTNFITSELNKRRVVQQEIDERIFRARLEANELQATSEVNLIERRLVNLELEEKRELSKIESNEQEKFALILEFSNRRKELEEQLSKARIEQTEKLNKEEIVRQKQLIEQQFTELEINLRQSGLETEELNRQLKLLEISRLEALATVADSAGESTAALRLQIQRLRDDLGSIKPDEFSGFDKILKDLFPDLNKDQINKLREGIKEIASEAQELLFNIFASVSDGYRAKAEELEALKEQQFEVYDEELERLQELNKNKILSDGAYNRQQRELAKKRAETEAEFNKKIAAEKEKAFKADRAAALVRVAIDTAENAVKVWALTVPQGILSAIAIAFGAAQAAIISSQPVPKFAKGTARVDGPGTPTSDSIPAMLSVGERVVPADTNRKYWPVLEAIRENRISPDILNHIAVSHQFAPVEAFMDSGKLTRSQRKIIPQQADAIGRAVAKYTSSEPYNSPLRQ